MDAGISSLLGTAGLSTIDQLYDTVQISTSLTPTVSFSLSPNAPPPDAVTQQILNTLQPTVTLTGPAGTVNLAPFGQTAGTQSWWPLALIGLGTVGFLGWAFFGD